MTRLWMAKALVGILVAGLVAALTVGEVLNKQAVARQEKSEAARMTGKMKTLCVGRFLIDLPEEAQVELSRARVHGFDISAFDEPFEQFQKRLEEREARIRAKVDRLGGNQNLELARQVKTDNVTAGKLFVHSRTVTEGTAANGLELERYRYEGIAAEALVHASGISIELGADNYSPDRIGNLSKLVAQLVPNPANKGPKEPGFCINRAYIRDPLKAEQNERIMMFARVPSHPDVEFVLILAAGLQPDGEGLLERDSAADARASWIERVRTSKLRAAPRTIGGIVGDELVRGAVEANGARAYSFWWEVNGTEDDVLVPHVAFKMDTGRGENGPVPSSLSQEAAIVLWNKISSSIRLHTARQTANRIHRPQTADSSTASDDPGRQTTLPPAPEV